MEHGPGEGGGSALPRRAQDLHACSVGSALRTAATRPGVRTSRMCASASRTPRLAARRSRPHSLMAPTSWAPTSPSPARPTTVRTFLSSCTRTYLPAQIPPRNVLYTGVWRMIGSRHQPLFSFGEISRNRTEGQDLNKHQEPPEHCSTAPLQAMARLLAHRALDTAAPTIPRTTGDLSVSLALTKTALQSDCLCRVANKKVAVDLTCLILLRSCDGMYIPHIEVGITLRLWLRRPTVTSLLQRNFQTLRHT